MTWSAFLWTYLWAFVGVGILAAGVLGFFIIRKLIKNHSQKKDKAPTGAKSAKKDKQAEKQAKKELRKQKRAEKKSQKKIQKEVNAAQEKVQARQPKQEATKTVEHDKQSKFALPRFDIKDVEIVENDLQKFKRHQELSLKNARTKQENNELLELNEHFSKTYHHIPKQNILADHTQTESGYYCFNGNQSKNFTAYCKENPYDATKDNGDRVIIQVNLGKSAKHLSFCVNPNDAGMINAAMADIDSTISKLNVNPTVTMVKVHEGKFKVEQPKTYQEFCQVSTKQPKAEKAPTPELEK